MTIASPDIGDRVNVPTLGISWPLLVVLITLAIAMSSGVVLADPDTYWHLATGRWILAHHAIPTHDVFSHSMAGAEWTAHEWAADLILTLVQQYAGWAGLQLLAGVCFALTLAYLMRFLLDRMQPVHALIAALLAGAMMYSHFLVRPHVLAWPLTAIWVGELVRCGEDRRRPPWWLLGVLLLWANLHASFTLALALGGALGLDAIMQESTWPARMQRARPWSLFLVLAGGVVLLNPHGIYAITYALNVMRMKSTLDLVNEWKSADFHEPQMLMLWLLLVMALGMSGRLRMPLVRSAMVLGLLYLALKHQRYHDLLGLISPFLFAVPIAKSTPSAVTARQDVDRLDRWFTALATPAHTIGMAITLVMAIAISWAGFHFRNIQPILTNTPEAALQAFERSGVTGPVFNAYNFGGYLIYRDVPVFIDGRSDMYGDALMTDIFNATQLRKSGSLEGLLSKYKIAWTLLAPSTPAVQLLDHLPQWRRLYGDSIAVVHVRRE